MNFDPLRKKYSLMTADVYPPDSEIAGMSSDQIKGLQKRMCETVRQRIFDFAECEGLQSELYEVGDATHTGIILITASDKLFNRLNEVGVEGLKTFVERQKELESRRRKRGGPAPF